MSQPWLDDGDVREREIMLRVKAMTGREPVGMLDLLRILAHPDVIALTRAYLESADES